MRVDGENRAVCEECGQGFMDGDRIIIAYEYETCGYFVSLPLIRVGSTLPPCEYRHTACAQRPATAQPGGLDALKATLTELPRADQQRLYRFMYDALGCRINR